MPSKAKRSTKRAPKKGKRARPSRKRNTHAGDYLQLIADPCMGPLVRSSAGGIGSNVVERVRKTLSAPRSAGDTSGYVVWFPSYHNEGSSDGFTAFPRGPGNLLMWQNADPAVSPVNTPTNPLGSVSVNTTGLFLRDPITPSLYNYSPFSRAKSLAACLQLDYNGKLSDASGQIAVVQCASIEALNKVTDLANPFMAPTVDDIFAYAAVRERIQLNGHEVKWRPSDSSSILRGPALESEGTSPSVFMTVGDTVFYSGGTGGTVPTQVSCSDPNNAQCVILAWRGIPAVAGCLTLNMVKVVELEIGARGFAIESTVPTTRAPEVPVDKLVQALDTTQPGWQIGSILKSSLNAAIRAKEIYNIYAPPELISNVGGSFRGSSRTPLLMDGSL